MQVESKYHRETALEVNSDLASAVGVEGSVFLQQVRYMSLDPAHRMQMEDGTYWAAATPNQWRGIFPFWSIHEMYAIAEEMEKLEWVTNRTILYGDPIKDDLMECSVDAYFTNFQELLG